MNKIDLLIEHGLLRNANVYVGRRRIPAGYEETPDYVEFHVLYYACHTIPIQIKVPDTDPEQVAAILYDVDMQGLIREGMRIDCCGWSVLGTYLTAPKITYLED